MLKAKVWNSDGSISKPQVALPVLQVVAGLVPAKSASADLLVSLARDLAQDAITSGTEAAAAASGTARAAGETDVARSQAWFADAEHLLASGKPGKAVATLAKVVRAS